MTPELKAQWITALRSGKYKQGKRVLRNEKEEFCVLGVLCDIVDPGGWFGPVEWKPIEESASTYPKVYLFGGLSGLPRNAKFDLSNLEMAILACLNDLEGKSFGELADYIEVTL